METIIGSTAPLGVVVPTSLEGAVPETQEVVPVVVLTLTVM